jgi:hypothetical protein
MNDQSTTKSTTKSTNKNTNKSTNKNINKNTNKSRNNDKSNDTDKSVNRKAAKDAKWESQVVQRKASNSIDTVETSTLLKDKKSLQEHSVSLMADHQDSLLVGEEYLGSLLPDVIDFRDRPYSPSLKPLPPQIHTPLYLNILDQKTEGACAGFALAAVLNLLARKQGREDVVSARMLYEMAKKFDDWPGEDYVGASCRGAIKGLFNMGVCANSDWPFTVNKPGQLTAYRAEQARRITIGAYYRVALSIADFHAALNETGAIYVSAMIHKGWAKNQISKGRIGWQNTYAATGGHAFAIVGYNATGFYVQNSRGEDWGNKGVAHWSYEDWQENIRDAWVFQLALPTPQVFPGYAREAISAGLTVQRAPRRNEIMGHFVHLDDGNFYNRGRYFSSLDDVTETAKRVAGSSSYDHILFYAHDSFSSPKVCAQKISAMQPVFKANRIYAYHFMYSSGFVDDVKTLLAERSQESEARLGSGHELSDRLVEILLGRSGRALWREMKYGAESAFAPKGDGIKVANTFLQYLTESSVGVEGKPIHLAGQGAGCLLLGRLLEVLVSHSSKPKISTVSLMAPTLTLEAYQAMYRPKISKIDDMTVYNLSENLELEDNVTGAYSKSIMHLIAKVLEDNCTDNSAATLLGLSRDVAALDAEDIEDVDFVVSQGDAQRNKNSTSRRHDDFERDPATMNHILRRILGQRPSIRFRTDHFGSL